MSNRYQRVSLFALGVSIVLMGVLSWWAGSIYDAGELRRGYWTGAVGFALPMLAVGLSWLWVTRARKNGDSTAVVSWLKPVLWVCVVLVALMLVFPFL